MNNGLYWLVISFAGLYLLGFVFLSFRGKVPIPFTGDDPDEGWANTRDFGMLVFFFLVNFVFLLCSAFPVGLVLIMLASTPPNSQFSLGLLGFLCLLYPFVALYSFFRFVWYLHEETWKPALVITFLPVFYVLGIYLFGVTFSLK